MNKVYVAVWTYDYTSTNYGVYSSKMEAEKCINRHKKYGMVEEYIIDERERDHEKYEEVEVVEEKKYTDSYKVTMK